MSFIGIGYAALFVSIGAALCLWLESVQRPDIYRTRKEWKAKNLRLRRTSDQDGQRFFLWLLARVASISFFLSVLFFIVGVIYE